jgi:putative endonuclease
MAYYVYILRSCVDNSYYKGFTEDPVSRIVQHNEGKSAYTKTKLPWEYVYLEVLCTKRDALIREKVLKKYSHSQIAQLILSMKNQLKEILG